MRAAPRRRPPVALAALLAVATLVAACAGTIGDDVVGVGSHATTSTAAPGAAPPGGPTTTLAPETTVPKPGSTGAGNPVTLAFAGDVHYDGSLATVLANAPDTMMAGIADAVQPADLAVVNLESAVTNGGDQQSKAFAFSASPTAFDSLAAGGFDVISMANNHGLDYGQSGLAQTLAAIRERQAPVIGIGSNEAEAYRPFTAEVNGQRIAVIAASQVIDSNLIASWTATAQQGGIASAKRVDRLVQEVARARAAADTVVVFVHWGTEKSLCPNEQQQQLAEQLVAAGADIVVGGHAHRVLSGGYLGDAYVGYGLGNLQFKAGSAEARESGVLLVKVTGRRIDEATWRPAQIGTDYLPRLLTGASAETAVGRWNERRACTGLADVSASAAASTTTTTP